jgi:hypothetical protein
MAIVAFVEKAESQTITSFIYILFYSVLTSSFYIESINKYRIDKNEKVKNDLTSRK